jgi:hypothetical protein
LYFAGFPGERTRKMYPYATHEEVMLKVRRLSKTREVGLCTLTPPDP